MLEELLKEKNMTIHQFSQRAGISYGYVYKLVHNESDILKCSFDSAKKMSMALELSLDQFFNMCQEDVNMKMEDFLHFRSSLQHKIKENEKKAILYILKSDLISKYAKNKEYEKSLYSLAALDYLCQKNGYELVSDYDEFRTFKLEKPFFPTRMASEFKDTVKCMSEFLKYNIWEVSLYDVC